MDLVPGSSLHNRKHRSIPADASQDSAKTSPIWQSAIDKYYIELEKGGIKAPAIDKDLWLIEDPEILLKEMQGIAAREIQGSKIWMTIIPRLEPVLLSLNEFAMVIAWALGMNGRVAAVLWGSIRLILKFAQPVLPSLLEMLEELKLVLPKARVYEQELPLSATLETALLDMYTELILFYAHSIAFFHNNPNIGKSRNAWSQFSKEFAQVLRELRGYSRRVDEIADMMRLSREIHSAEAIKVIATLQDFKLETETLPCYTIPYGLNLRFYGRSSEVKALKIALDPRENDEILTVMAICGLGGVGKTQLALHYANTSMELYDAIAWIHADTQAKLVHSLATFATKLGLSTSQSSGDDYQAVQQVKDWLNTSNKRFLLVFDNVDNVSILNQIWPASKRGRIIITSRSPSIAYKRATNIIHLKSFGQDSAVNVLYELTDSHPHDESNVAAAKEICQTLGGLPLAMAHVSSFIRDRGYSYDEFLEVYQKFAEKIFIKSEQLMEYEHTLGTVWDISLQNLSSTAQSLQKLLSMFDPDTISERLLALSVGDVDENPLGFLHDEFEFGESVIELVQSSLLNRTSESKSLSMHRLVQFAVIRRLSKDEKSFYFQAAVDILSRAFPNTWNDGGAQQGHGWREWEVCSIAVPHTISLMSLADKYRVKAKSEEVFAELIFRIATYLWESEQPSTSQSLFQYGLKLDIDPASSLSAQAYRLLGHIGLDLARPKAALSAYKKALQAREILEEPNSPPIAAVYDSIACSLTETGDTVQALEYLSKADAIHLSHNSQLSARTLAIYAMTYLRANQPGKALESLLECWKLQGKTEQEISSSKYPKHSGDINLLARIKHALGEKQEAQYLASRSLTMRRGTYGAKGPRVADSMFIVARMLEQDNEHVVAGRMLKEIIDMSRDMVEMKGHLARATWYLATIEVELGNPLEAAELRESARKTRSDIDGREAPDEDSDDAFSSLVGWMLW